MQNLINLVRNTFQTDLHIEEIELFDPQILDRIDSMVASLRLSVVSFNDTDFQHVYEHTDYNYLKSFLELYKHKKDLKLPKKDE